MIKKVKKKTSPVYNLLLIYIVAGIILGTFLGGLFPSFAVNVGFIGEVFLHLLMMLVIPLVVLSMIVGITGLGDIRNVGKLGWNTILYYFSTTALAVLVGLIGVNLIKPGSGIKAGEYYPNYSYRIDSTDQHHILLLEGKWNKSNYDQKFELVLEDQGVQGIIESVEGASAHVSFWEKSAQEEKVHFRSEEGSIIPFLRENGELTSREPNLNNRGTGINIRLGVAQRLKGKEGGNLTKTLKEVILGNEETGKQGLIPRNIFMAMTNLDILSLIFFSLLFGAALSVLGKKVEPLIHSIRLLNEAIMKLVEWIMYLAPIGIFGLIAARIGEAGGFSKFLPELMALGKYSATVFLGLAFHAFVTLPVLLYFLGKKSPLRYARGMGAALLNAFSTASSSASLPLTLEGVEKENGISQRTASFVLPLGATINMDGTALYESVAAIFIAQVYGIEMGFVEQTVVFVTATLAAIGAAGIPEAGLVTLVIVLKAVGLPIEGVALILTIDWLLDRFRTTVNVWGDSVGAAIIDELN